MTTPPSYLADHGDAIEEIGTLYCAPQPVQLGSAVSPPGSSRR
jgi:hypothetical protein